MAEVTKTKFSCDRAGCTKDAVVEGLVGFPDGWVQIFDAGHGQRQFCGWKHAGELCAAELSRRGQVAGNDSAAA